MPAARDTADPIAQLLDELTRDGKPSLAWVIRWSQSGGDPVAAAWAASRDSARMFRLLRLCDPDAIERIRPRLPMNGAVLGLADDAPDILRRVVPAPPTLEQLLAARPSR